MATILAGCGSTSAAVSIPAHSPSTPAVQPHQWPSPPPMQIHTGDQYQAVVDTTAGSFTIQLFAKQDPRAVNNFVFLADHQYFNGNQFFRVLKSFVIQSGDPTNTGLGTPGYQWKGELPPPFPYGPRIVAMANSGSPNSQGSQFFICTGSQSEQLNRGQPIYTEFGRVSSGWHTVQTIADGPVVANPRMGGEVSRPVHPVSILQVHIQVHKP